MLQDLIPRTFLAGGINHMREEGTKKARSSTASWDLIQRSRNVGCLSPPRIPTLPAPGRLCNANLPNVNTARLRLNGPPGFEGENVRYGFVLFYSDLNIYIYSEYRCPVAFTLGFVVVPFLLNVLHFAWLEKKIILVCSLETVISGMKYYWE